ncbi:MAG: mechanosensitive ion channel family protein [Pirellulales bacterium]
MISLACRQSYAENLYPLEPADTSSPRATLISFRNACDEAYEPFFRVGRGDFDQGSSSHILTKILDCLDLSQEPEFNRGYTGREAAACLKEVLDRIEYPLDEEIPGEDEIRDENGEILLNQWRVPHTEIVISRITEGPKEGAYQFSAATVSRAKEFYLKVEKLPYQAESTPGLYQHFLSEPKSRWMAAIVHRLPEWTHKRHYGQAIWQWVGLSSVIVLGLFLMFLAHRIGQANKDKIEKLGIIRYILNISFPIAAMLIPLLAREFIANDLSISGSLLAITKFSCNVVFLGSIIVVIFSASNRIAEVIILSPGYHPKGLDAQLIRIVSRIGGIVMGTVVFLEGGQYLGIPLTTLLAGAGVGGLAVALAAQDTLKNVFGSIMIILDKPYRVGERIVMGTYDGVVEEIGIRSTKIRLLTGHLATIPNEEMARSDIENVGRRTHIRRVSDIAIRLDTSPEKTEQAVKIIHDILKDHEGLNEKYPPRVYFSQLSRDCLMIRMMYWYHPPEYWDYMAFSEKVNLQIKRQFAAAGIELALPSQNLMLTNEPEQETPAT